MIKIQCEVCGANEFEKKDDFFVCHYCGCKYSLEQVKK